MTDPIGPVARRYHVTSTVTMGVGSITSGYRGGGQTASVPGIIQRYTAQGACGVTGVRKVRREISMATSGLAIELVQDEFPVGDIPGNAQRVLDRARDAVARGIRILVFPELTLTGYPPEDLLLRPSLDHRIERALDTICSASLPVALVIGLPWRSDSGLHNGAVVIDHGEVKIRYAKHHLPNYQVFDEHRYFVVGHATAIWECDGCRVGLAVCEDIWFNDVLQRYREAGVDLVLALNASPYYVGRAEERLAHVQQQAKNHQLAILYVNANATQDELVFDGGSLAVNADGQLVARARCFESGLLAVDWRPESGLGAPKNAIESWPDRTAGMYQALVRGLAGYVNRNGFRGVILGLSGGIDSGLSLAIAVDALGADRVKAVMMPFRYTSEISRADAAEEARNLGVDYRQLPIESIYDAAMQTLAPVFGDQQPDLTEQNLQARIRGLLLMAMSNREGWMVLTTGNKSELAVGYATLYGDMCGGYNALKDVPKQWVFELARYRNSIEAVIPERVITRPPSAELAPDQKDEDSLPGYDVLDAIIERYVERDESADAIVAAGFAREEVARVIQLIDRNEYKRRQAPEGVRVTPRGFGRDRRYPITQSWAPGD